MLRVAGSIKLGTVNPTQLIQAKQRGGKPTMLGRTIANLDGSIRHSTSLLILMMKDIDAEF